MTVAAPRAGRGGRWLAPLAATATVWLLTATAWAGAREHVDAVIARGDRPEGVVFEIVSGNADLLEWAVPFVRRQIVRLRDRYPELDVAVVSHGSEQFALASGELDGRAGLHDAVELMVLEEDTPVHVCGTHAGWRGLDETDFPDYVDVVPAGPSQIDAYVELGYRLVIVSRTEE